MPRITRTTVPILSAKATTGIGAPYNVTNYRHVSFLFSADTNSTLTVKFQGSLLDAQPDFSARTTEANAWDYIAVYDIQDPSSVIAGDTGFTVSNETIANNHHIFHVNTDVIQWVCAEVTAWTDGAVTVKAVCAND